MGNRSIGNRIRKIREQLKWTQEKLGDYLDVKGNTVCNYEKGDVKTLSPETLVKLAELGEVSLEWLLMGKEKKYETSLTPEEHELLADFQRADPEDHPVILQIVKFIADKRKKEGV